MEILLCERLKELRLDRHLTQKAVAKELGISSISYLHYEKGQREPSLETLVDLAIFFGVTVDYILGVRNY